MGQIDTKWDKSGTFQNHLSVHFGSPSKNVLMIISPTMYVTYKHNQRSYKNKHRCVILSTYKDVLLTQNIYYVISQIQTKLCILTNTTIDV